MNGVVKLRLTDQTFLRRDSTVFNQDHQLRLSQESVSTENHKKRRSNLKPERKFRDEAGEDDATEAITSRKQKPAKTVLESHRFPESGPEERESMPEETIGNKTTVALSLSPVKDFREGT